MENKFTLSLAFVDAIPILIFGATLFVIANKLSDIFFLIGGVLCILAGLCKVIWKIILAKSEKDIKALCYIFRLTMPAGFALMIFGVVRQWKAIEWSIILKNAISFPAFIFILLTIICMIAMITMASKLNQNNAKHNWIEEFANIIFQLFILLSVVFIVK